MFRLACLLCACTLLLLPSAASAQPDPVFDLLGRINALRRQNGLAPYELNDALSAAALRHSRDMANAGFVSHTGSDGSTADRRIDDAGYAPHNAWGENIYGGGFASVDAAWGFWTTSTVHRNNLLNGRYREIGIGVATAANGTYYTLVFGSRPGVLPFFVEQGSLLSDPRVTLTLSNEEASPGGASDAMGEAFEARVGEGEDLGAAAWQPWQRTIAFTLSNAAGQHRITVEYRDAGGTIASYFRLVTLDVVAPAATNQPANQPTDQPTNTATATATPEPAATKPPTALPSATFTPVPSPSFTASPASRPTRQPSHQPTLAPTTPAVETPSPKATANSLSPNLLDTLIASGWSDAPDGWLAAAVGLQIVALVLGAAALIRRSTKS